MVESVEDMNKHKVQVKHLLKKYKKQQHKKYEKYK